jgi:hypothetical protein
MLLVFHLDVSQFPATPRDGIPSIIRQVAILQKKHLVFSPQPRSRWSWKKILVQNVFLFSLAVVKCWKVMKIVEKHLWLENHIVIYLDYLGFEFVFAATGSGKDPIW